MHDNLEVYERYGDCSVCFVEYNHGILTFAGLSPVQDVALCAVIYDPPKDFAFDINTVFTLGELPFNEVLVYNPDNEVVARYVA